MGSLFAKYFCKHGHRVAGFDRKRVRRRAAGVRFAKSSSEAVREADVVLVAVPIKETVGAVRQALPSIKDGAVLVEITSVKDKTISSLKKVLGKRKVSLLSLHPLFGPYAQPEDFKFCVVGGRHELSAARKLFPTARLVQLNAREHDRLMAYTLSLVHVINLAFASAVTKRARVKAFKGTASPMASEQLNLSQAVLSQSPSLFAQIQTENPFAREVLSAFIAELTTLRRMIAKADGPRLEKRFADVAGKFGDAELQRALWGIYARGHP